ncbi:MAG: WD40 repeat domain-containing protein [Gammaproteobacteria bacterium]
MMLNPDAGASQEAVAQAAMEERAEAEAASAEARQRLAARSQSSSTAGLSEGVLAVGFSADGRYIVARNSETATVWEVAAHKPVGTLPTNDMAGTQSEVRIAADCHLLQRPPVHLAESTVRDCRTGTEIARASLISDDTSTAVSGPPLASRRALSGLRGSPSEVTITNLATGVQSIMKTSAGAMPLALSANGDTLLTYESGVHSAGWRSATSDAIGFVGGFAQALIPGVGLLDAMGANEASNAIGTTTPEMIVDIVAWNVHTRHKVLSVRVAPQSANAVLSSDGRVLIVESEDRSIDTYELPSGHKRRIVEAELPTGGVTFGRDQVVASVDGRKVARMSADGSVDIFNTVSGKKLASFPAKDWLNAAGSHSIDVHRSTMLPAFSADGALIAIGELGQVVHVWDVASSRSVFQTRASAIAFSPDGQAVLLARPDASAPIWHDLGTGNEQSFPAP